MIKGPKTTAALEIVLANPDGVESQHVATALGVTQATAAGILARLFWRALVDRATVGRKFVYTPRTTIAMNERWRLELNSEAPYNPPMWVELRDVTGKRYRFQELADAEAAKDKLLASQLHLKDRLRIVPV